MWHTQIFFIVNFLVISFLFLDAIIHQIWLSRTKASKLTEFSELVELIKHSPQIFDNKSNVLNVLTYITWNLNVNINIIGLKRSRNFFKCTHLSSSCYFLFYIFQNPYVKLQRRVSEFSPINIIYFKRKYFFMPYTKNVPFLINILPLSFFVINDISFSKTEILQIIDNKEVHLPLNLLIFTSYTYVRSKNSNKIIENIIGKHIFQLDEPFHCIFLTPHLIDDDFDISIINLNVNKRINELFINNYPSVNLKEGIHTLFGQRKINPSNISTEYCICENEKTKRLHLPTWKDYKHLGKK